MRKIFALFLSLGIVVCGASESEATQTEDAAASLQRAFNGKEPFYAITVTRAVDSGEPLFLDEAELVFACIKLIAGHKKADVKKTLKENLERISKQHAEHVNKLHQTSKTKEKIAAIRQKKILDKFNETSQKFPEEHLEQMKKGWKLCIFNEMFFSKRMPLSSKLRGEVLKNISALSDKKTLVHVNFLYSEQGKDKFTQLEFNRIKRNLSPRRQSSGGLFSRFLFENTQTYKTIEDHLERYLDRISPLVDKKNHTYLLNKSDILWDKKTVCYYKKSSYFREHDNSLKNGFVYDVGDGKDHKYSKLSEEQNSIANVILKNISSEICFDLASGVRQENSWRNSDSQSKIHILVSNCIFSELNHHFLPPSSILIAHVDPFLNGRPLNSQLKMNFQLKNSNPPSIFTFAKNATVKDIRKINHSKKIELTYEGKTYTIQSYNLRKNRRVVL